MIFPDIVPADEMGIRTKEWRLLGYDIGLLHDTVLVGKRVVYEPGNVDWIEPTLYSRFADGRFCRSAVDLYGNLLRHAVEIIEDLGTWR